MDAETRQLHEYRQRHLHDKASIESVIAEGETRGEQKKALEMAKELLKLGVEVSIVVTATKLSIAEVEALMIPD
ncbi:hypothetical protein HUB98_16765 [Paenibacillus barcinonensis]|uniref:Transposase/invertase (TIGR01784 family) n=2 Tax=Paenibacillus barcinonensis TaxID=198119 RepID=A0ABX6QE34_PAEBA|nr:hypothetical protein [Paenibacillus barcinonensis]QKS60202.1 hypothetical protein HUB98_16765 [Paenibacillus barcinonensis]